MAREPELSIKVKVDPQIDAAKLQEDINKKISKDGVEIKGKLDVDSLLKSVSKYQEGDQHLVPIMAKISNVDKALDVFKEKETETKVNLKATQASLDTIRDQLQGVIDGLDYSKLEGASTSTSTTSTKHTKKGKKTTAVDASTAAKQEIPVDVVGTISDDSVTALKTKIEAGLNDIAIVANIAPDQLSKIRKDVEAAFNGIAITPTVKGVNGAAAQTGAKKKINIPSDDKIMEQMANAQYTATKNENAEAAAVKQKDIIYQNLTDLLAKAAKYYAEVGNAAKQTADSIAVANEGFANQTTELEKNNAELEKLKQNGVTTVKENTVDAPSIAEKVALNPEDITPPKTPVEIPGHVTLTENDITVPKSPIELKGNIAIENSGTSNDETSATKTKKKSRFRPVDSDDLKIQQEANKLLQQEEQEQQKIARAAQKKADAENKAFNREVAAEQKKYNQAELDNLKEIESIYRELTSLEKQRGKYTNPDKAFDLNQVEEDIRMVESELSEKMRSASETGYNPLKVKSIRKQALRYYRAQASSDNKFDIAKQNADAEAQKEAKKALDEEAAERDKVAQAAQKQAIATQKANEAAAKSQRKQDEKNVGSVIDDIVSESNKLIRLYQQRSGLVKPEDVATLTEIDNKISDIVDKIQVLKDNSIASGIPINNFTEVANANTLVERARANSSTNFNKNQQAYNLTQATNAIETAKAKYINAFAEIQKKREELAKTDDLATQQMIQNAIATQKAIMKASGHEINSYSQQYGGLVDSA